MQTFILAILFGVLQGYASAPLRVSVITCAPGKEVYELYGHTAIRIKGANFDSVWNYGIFDFSEPNFVGRFVKGDLMYAVAGYPFQWFMPEYVASGRRVIEQVLAFDSIESQQLLHALQVNALPENRKYPYDYVKDNCSTRVWDQIRKASSTPLADSTASPYPTFREAMRAYHSHYPWYALGIDITLGYPVDTLITADDALFLPEALRDRLNNARRPDGAPLVSSEEILYSGTDDATLPPTPWWLSPVWWSWIVFAGAVIYEWRAWRKNISPGWFEAIFFGLVGVAGCVISYLVFISSHDAASPNLLLAWLNPIALVVPTLIWWRRTRGVVVAYMVANIFAIILLSIVWPFQLQSGNPAFIPLGVTDLLLSAGYIALYGKQLKHRNGLK